MACANHTDRTEVAVCEQCGDLVCPECRTRLSGKSYCPACLERVARLRNSESPGLRDPCLAGILGLIFPGAGQVYNGQVLKGLLVFFFAFLIIPWIYGIVDAVIVAQNRNQDIRLARAG